MSAGTAVLLEVAAQFGGPVEADRLAARVVEQIVTLLRAERALFALFDHAGRVEHVVHHGFDDWQGLPTPLPVSQSIIADAVSSRELVVESVREDGATWSPRLSARALHLRFLFALPVEAHGEVVGVLYVDSRQSALRDVGDVETTLIAVGRLVGAAVENARLWEEVALRNLLLAQVVNEFAQPVSAIRLNAAEILQPGASAAETLEAAVDIAAAGSRMHDLVTTTLELVRATGDGDDTPIPLHRSAPHDPSARTLPSRVDIGAALGRQVAGMREIQRAARVQVHLEVAPGLAAIAAPPERLRAAFSYLLHHGVRYARPGSELRILASERPAEDPPRPAPRSAGYGAYLFRRSLNLVPVRGTPWVQVEVRVGGWNPTEGTAAGLFEPWPRGPAAGGYRWAPDFLASGNGLPLVEQCVRSLGGVAWVDTSDPVGASLALALPVHAEVV